MPPTQICVRRLALGTYDTRPPASRPRSLFLPSQIDSGAEEQADSAGRLPEAHPLACAARSMRIARGGRPSVSPGQRQDDPAQAGIAGFVLDGKAQLRAHIEHGAVFGQDEAMQFLKLFALGI